MDGWCVGGVTGCIDYDHVFIDAKQNDLTLTGSVEIRNCGWHGMSHNTNFSILLRIITSLLQPYCISIPPRPFHESTNVLSIFLAVQPVKFLPRAKQLHIFILRKPALYVLFKHLFNKKSPFEKVLSALADTTQNFSTWSLKLELLMHMVTVLCRP